MIEPVLSRILVYPVKSLDGLERASVGLLPSGALALDRTWALFDAQGAVVNGKRHAAVHRLRATVDARGETVSLRDEAGRGLEPETFALAETCQSLEAWLRRYFGFPVGLRRNVEVGYPDDLESPGPTVISVATLREIGRWFGLTIEQVRARLRTNLEIDGVPPFWEDRLFAAKGSTVRFRVGEVVLEGVNPCQRCAVPPRDPVTGANDETFVRRFTELRDRTLPAWSTRERFNHFYRVAINTRLSSETGGRTIRVGDRIEILDLPRQADAHDTFSTDRPTDFWAGDLVVDAVRDETASVTTFRLRTACGGALPFRFAPGQFLAVTVGSGTNAAQRCYTIASSPAQTAFCEITVKREGQASTVLHETVRPGDRLAVSGPMGRFTFDGSTATRVLFVAGGVGITPLMSQLRTLAGQRWAGRVDLIYSVRSGRDIVFRDELDTLRRTWPAFGLHVTVTGADPDWAGPRGRFSADWVRSVVPDVAARHVRLCGPTAFAASAQSLLRRLGVADAQVAMEAFGGRPRQPSQARTGADRQVRFARSACDARVAADETLLDAALAAGVALDHGCRAGVCGRCRTRLLDGEITVDCDFALTPDEKTAGMILSCQARPLGNVVLDC